MYLFTSENKNKTNYKGKNNKEKEKCKNWKQINKIKILEKNKIKKKENDYWNHIIKY